MRKNFGQLKILSRKEERGDAVQQICILSAISKKWSYSRIFEPMNCYTIYGLQKYARKEYQKIGGAPPSQAKKTKG